MDLKRNKIGFVPTGIIGDRRRFAYYARARGLEFEIASPEKDYDLVVATLNADFGVWSEYRRGEAKIVFDCTDSYYAIPRGDLKGLLRGAAKSLAGQNRYLRLSYWRMLEDMWRRADAVVCTTEEQAEYMGRFCANVHVIQDFHGMLRGRKTQYACRPDVFNIVWEGLPMNVETLAPLSEVLKNLHRKRPLALHVVTDLEYRPYLGKFGLRRTFDQTRALFERAYLYEWNEFLAPAVISACDLAIIPVPLDDPLRAGKPANKLLLFWRLGMPALVSATPAYVRTMADCGLEMICRGPEDWELKLEKYMADEDARREAGERGRAFAESRYGEQSLLKAWDAVFASIMKAR